MEITKPPILTDEQIEERLGAVRNQHIPKAEKRKCQRDDTFWETLKILIEVLKTYGISITNDGILAPYSDEWDYLYDTPRRVLLKGNDKAESAKSLFEAIKRAH